MEENNNKKEIIKVWGCLNKNGFLSTHLEEPKRNKDTGKWISNKPFCNSLVYKQLENLFNKSSLSWESEPEYFEISYNK